MFKAVVTAVAGLVLGAGLLYVAVPSSGAPAPAPVAKTLDGGAGGCC